jgi:hypothetical protein
MRTRRTLAIALATVATLGLAAGLPLLVATPPPTAAYGPLLLPQELVGDLYEECYVEFEMSETTFPMPLPRPDGTLAIQLASVDNQTGELDYVDPSPEQAAVIEEIDACFARWPVDNEWNGAPQFQGAQARLYDDYVARVLTPCLRIEGLEVTELRVPLQTIDMLAWYFRQLEPLDLEQSVAVWTACPLVPNYLTETAYPEGVDFEVFG